MKTLKVLMGMIFFTTVVAGYSYSFGGERIDPVVPPQIDFKEEIRLVVGVARDPFYNGFYFVKYEEISGRPGVFSEKKSTFFNSWLIFEEGRDKDNKLIIVKPLHLVLRLWIYDPETMTKTCHHWAITSEGIHFMRFAEDNSNSIIDSGELVELTPQQAENFLPLIRKILNEFQRRLKESKPIFFLDAYDGITI